MVRGFGGPPPSAALVRRILDDPTGLGRSAYNLFYGLPDDQWSKDMVAIADEMGVTARLREIADAYKTTPA